MTGSRAPTNKLFGIAAICYHILKTTLPSQRNRGWLAFESLNGAMKFCRTYVTFRTAITKLSSHAYGNTPPYSRVLDSCGCRRCFSRCRATVTCKHPLRLLGMNDVIKKYRSSLVTAYARFVLFKDRFSLKSSTESGNVFDRRYSNTLVILT